MNTLPHFDFYIDGGPASAQTGAAFESINPTLGAPWATVAAATEADVDRAVQSARAAFHSDPWASLSPTRRGRMLMRFADSIATNAEELAKLETRENGKLYREMVAQLRVIPEWLYYYGGLADKIEGRVIPVERQSVLNYTTREPLGVIGVIVPWNSPSFLTVMAAAPALAAGNTVVVKPSEVTPVSALRLAELASEAGLPPGVLNVVTGDGSSGRALARNPGVAKIAFTGGTATGKSLAAEVGQRLGRYTLELGGKSANIVFADAPQEAAIAGVLAGIFAAGGQTCVAGSRALIHEAVYDEVVGTLVDRAKAIRLGDPMNEETQMGPIATKHQRDRIEGLVDETRRADTRVLCGGGPATPAGFEAGFFYMPTIVERPALDSGIWQEEVFGPVLTVMPFQTDQEAVELANATRYGLAAGVWTRDIQRAHLVARQLQAGTVWINLYRAMAFNSPFGGYKDSGVGRENGREAIFEYLQTKSVWCELSSEVQDPFVLKL